MDDEFVKTMDRLVKEDGLALFSDLGRRNEVIRNKWCGKIDRPYRDAMEKCLDYQFPKALRDCVDENMRLQCKEQYAERLKNEGIDLTIANEVLNVLETFVLL
jgi:hypothetical protein